jgi:hypothetical protein
MIAIPNDLKFDFGLGLEILLQKVKMNWYC